MEIKKSFKSVSAITAITGEDYINLLLDAGIAYAAKVALDDAGLLLISSNRCYWQWYVQRWVDADESFALQVACMSKKFRENKEYNLTAYINSRYEFDPGISYEIAKLAGRLNEPYCSSKKRMRIKINKPLNKIRNGG